MSKAKIIFTDSGLGGLSIMADFVRLIDNYSLDILFFNAQYKRGQGYRTMDKSMQLEIFDRALEAMQNNFKADFIAIACNTLSVVFQHSKYKQKSSAKIYDIVATGQKLIKESAYDTIIELAMPTTIKSRIYKNNFKNIISVATEPELPDAIESNNKEKIKKILQKAFLEVKSKLSAQNLSHDKLSLFLGCTHFPLIKGDFFEIAEEFGISFSELLNPNTEFANLIFDNIRKSINKSDESAGNLIKLISRVKLKDSELTGISSIISKHSPQTAAALINYEYKPDLF